MRRMLAAVTAVVVLLVVGVAAAVATRGGDSHHPGSGMHRMTGMHGMSGHLGGSAADSGDEADFLREMVAHHHEAVDAAAELQRSERSAMRAFGRDIVATQSAEIEQMERWLADWHPGEPTEATYEPMMRDLSGLTGDRLDRAFLEDMIGHHMMAVMMSQRLLMHGAAEHDPVADLARTIRTTQVREIGWMRDRLSSWFDSSDSHHQCGSEL